MTPPRENAAGPAPAGTNSGRRPFTPCPSSLPPMRTLALALVALATPAFAQAGPVVGPDTVQAADPAVDPALVGEWTLARVVEPGALGDYGVEIQAMTCLFSADGHARVSMAAVQDGDTMSRQREFEFETEAAMDGPADVLEIVEASGDRRVAYRLTDDGLLELTDDGMVILLVRAP